MVIGQALELWDKNESLIILEHLLDRPRLDILMDKDCELSQKDEEEFRAIVSKRKNKYPLQYLIGEWSFYDFDVDVEPGVLIPRPETELLVEEALKELEHGSKILEIGTGTGVISIGLARHLTLDITASDISKEALSLAKRNSKKNKVDIEFIKSDLYENIRGTYDLIISNPPYIREDQAPKLEGELSYEPKEALFSGEEGLDLIERLIEGAPGYLKAGGLVLLEIGYDQGNTVRELFKGKGFSHIEILKDYNEYDRIAKAFFNP